MDNINIQIIAYLKEIVNAHTKILSLNGHLNTFSDMMASSKGGTMKTKKPPIALSYEGLETTIKIVNLLRDGTPMVQLVTFTKSRGTSQQAILDACQSHASELNQLLDNLALPNEMFEVRNPFRALFVIHETNEVWLIHEIVRQ